MHSLSRINFHRRQFLAALLLVSMLSSQAFAWQGGASAPAVKATATLTPPELKTANRLKVETIRDGTTTLSSNEIESRGTGHPAAGKVACDLADRFAKLVLRPARENSTYLQSIKNKSTKVLPESSLKI